MCLFVDTGSKSLLRTQEDGMFPRGLTDVASVEGKRNAGALLEGRGKSKETEDMGKQNSTVCEMIVSCVQ